MDRVFFPGNGAIFHGQVNGRKTALGSCCNAGAAVEGVTVNGSWTVGTTGTGTCVTDTSGSCEIIKNSLKTTVGSVTFEVTGLAHDVLTDSGEGDRSLLLTQPLN